MTPEQAAQVLAKAACYDPMFSKPSPALANGWADAFTRYGIGVDDAMAAVAEHYVQSPDRVMPAHVIRLARKLRQERSDREGPDERAAREARIDAKIEAAQRRAEIDAPHREVEQDRQQPRRQAAPWTNHTGRRGLAPAFGGAW